MADSRRLAHKCPLKCVRWLLRLSGFSPNRNSKGKHGNFFPGALATQAQEVMVENTQVNAPPQSAPNHIISLKTWIFRYMMRPDSTLLVGQFSLLYWLSSLGGKLGEARSQVYMLGLPCKSFYLIFNTYINALSTLKHCAM